LTLPPPHHSPSRHGTAALDFHDIRQGNCLLIAGGIAAGIPAIPEGCRHAAILVVDCPGKIWRGQYLVIRGSHNQQYIMLETLVRRELQGRPFDFRESEMREAESGENRIAESPVSNRGISG
jgi:hypothetical protein